MSCMCFERVSERGLDAPAMPPEGWHIVKNVKPIPDRQFDWDYWHENYDGVEDGNRLCGAAASWDDAVAQCWEMEFDAK